MASPTDPEAAFDRERALEVFDAAPPAKLGRRASERPSAPNSNRLARGERHARRGARARVRSPITARTCVFQISMSWRRRVSSGEVMRSMAMPFTR